MTWISTHTLDPFRPLDAPRSRTGRCRPASSRWRSRSVALDWKWLFIYPEQGIATVNEMAAPVDVPIAFKITSSSVMNTFYVPALAGMIYAMPGMQTQLHAVINKAGDLRGLSGITAGRVLPHELRLPSVRSKASTSGWRRSRRPERPLDRDTYLELEKPSEAGAGAVLSAVENGLFDAILSMCVAPGQMCVARDAPHRPDGRRRPRTARRTASGWNTTIAAYGAATSRRRHRPGIGTAAPRGTSSPKA